MNKLPSGWAHTTLGELVTLRVDKLDPADVPNASFIGLEDIEPHTSVILNVGKAADVRSSVARFEAGDILYSRLRPYLNKVTVPDFGGVASAEILAMQATTATVPEFVRRRIMTGEFLEFAARLDKGDRPRVNFKDIAEFPIALPPLAEQRRIVAKLDELTARTSRTAKELARIPALIARYKQRLLALAFSGELTASWRSPGRHANKGDGSLPNGWKLVPLAEISEIQGGIQVGKRRRGTPKLVSVPYLRVANVQRGWLRLDEIKSIAVTADERERLLLKGGDILMNEGGDRDKLGRGWVWNDEIPGCIHQNHVFRIRLRDADFPSKYISHYANENGQRYFFDQGTQTTNLASVSKSKVAALPVPLPPIEEAREIVDRIETAFSWLDRIAADQAAAVRLLPKLDAAILSKAFCGELTPRNPEDEPASALLERIRKEREASGNESRKARGRTKGTAIESVHTNNVQLRTRVKGSPMSKSRQDDDVIGKPYLASKLKNMRSGLVEDLFKAAGLPVSDFYKQLTWEIENGHIVDSAEELRAA